MNLLTPALLAAIDIDEQKHIGHKLLPSTIEYIKTHGEPDIEMEFRRIQKLVKREELLYQFEACRQAQRNRR